jgi:hemoglobin-like flavoprotein
MMEQKTIELVQESFEKVKPIAGDAAVLFYQKLFEMDPALKKLFPPDEASMAAQRGKLMTMLGSAVTGLTNLEILVPILQDLGKRHVQYNVEPSHYTTVGAALIDTLSAGLGEHFTPEVKAAWIQVYQTMSDVMIQASYKATS